MTTPSQGSTEPPIPTDAELRILRVLWERGGSTVREVLDELPGDRNVGYTTVLKLLQIMHEKGLVARDERARTHVYTARVAEQRTERRLVSDLIDRAFSGSAATLVMRALADRAATPEELAEIRRLIDRLEEGAT
jgi:BlaI family transcriptional regulator, penicillinase repressor